MVKIANHSLINRSINRSIDLKRQSSLSKNENLKIEINQSYLRVLTYYTFTRGGINLSFILFQHGPEWLINEDWALLQVLWYLVFYSLQVYFFNILKPSFKNLQSNLMPNNYQKCF